MKAPIFLSYRGYRAEVIYDGPERFIYHAWDEKGEKLQHNGCRAPADFHREWRAK